MPVSQPRTISASLAIKLGELRPDRVKPLAKKQTPKMKGAGKRAFGDSTNTTTFIYKPTRPKTGRENSPLK